MYRSGISLKLFEKLNFCSWFWESPNDRVLAKLTDCWLAHKLHFFLQCNGWLEHSRVICFCPAAIHCKHSVHIWQFDMETVCVYHKTWTNLAGQHPRDLSPCKVMSCWPIVALTCDLHFSWAVGEERLHCYSITFNVVFSVETQQQSNIQWGDRHFRFSRITPRSQQSLTLKGRCTYSVVHSN